MKHMKKTIAYLAALAIVVSALNPIAALSELLVTPAAAEGAVTAAEAAASITALEVDQTTDRLILPAFDGMQVTILSSSDERLIATDGTVNRVYGGRSEIVLQITDELDNTATTSPISVVVESCMLEKTSIQEAQASSSHPIWPATHMYNGDWMSGFWSNGDDAPQSVEVVATIQEATDLYGVVLYPRYTMDTTYFPTSFDVFVSNDRESWTLATQVSNYRITSYDEAQSFVFDSAIHGKYVKLVMTRGQSPYVQIAELQVLTRKAAESIAQAAERLTLRQVEDRILFDGISEQFRVEIADAQPGDILSANGQITYPAEDTPMELSIRIVNRVNTEDVLYLTRTFTVKCTNSVSVEKVAQTIDLIPCPANDATQLTLPAVPEGYSIQIAETTHPTIVDLTGKITRSDDETYGVRVTFRITDNATGASALTEPLLVPIYKTYVAPTMSDEEIDAIHDAYEAKAYGMFIHYISNYSAWGGTLYADGTPVQTVDEAADAFDAAAFAKSMHEFGVEYVVLTCWHGDSRTLFPSMTNQRWRDDRRAEDSHGKKSYSERDVIMDLLDELEPYGIDLHLYTHPTDGHDFTEEDQRLTGHTDASDNYAVWNQYINELYYELCERYGNRIKGLWFDGLYGLTSGDQNQTRLRETCLSFNPAMILTMNTGFEEGNMNPAPGYTCPDYRAWEVNRFVDFVNDMKVSRYQSAIVLAGQGWWTTQAQSTTFPLHAPEDIFKYIVAMAAASTHGGFLASTGFYPVREGEDLNGDYFMNGIRDMLLDVNQLYLEPVQESIKNTKNSSAYRTKQNVFIKDLKWGVATESQDGRYIYLHVLNAPSGQTLNLSAPSDKTQLLPEAVILNFDGTTTAVSIEETDTGYAITLPAGVTWSSVDTVIKVERMLSDAPDAPTDPDGEETTTPESTPSIEPGTDAPTEETTATDTETAVDDPLSSESDEKTTAADTGGCQSLIAASGVILTLTAAAAVMAFGKRRTGEGK